MLIGWDPNMAQLYKCKDCGGEISIDRMNKNNSLCVKCEEADHTIYD